jgi:glucose-6-phosphate isomerase
MGQYIQQGRRNLFETVLAIEGQGYDIGIPDTGADTDGIGYIAGMKLDDVNKTAMEATVKAHTAGGVPNIIIRIPGIDENYLGQLVYFFELSCAISGYILGINPFDQPGVEAYKTEMFKMLGKPGY